MTPAPKRRWFRWSLRTMFVLVAALACLLGWNVNLVRQRRALINSDHLGKSDVAWFQQWGSRDVELMYAQKSLGSKVQLSKMRELLGDVPISIIVVPHKADSDALKPLFAESTICYVADPTLADSLAQFRREKPLGHQHAEAPRP